MQALLPFLIILLIICVIGAAIYISSQIKDSKQKKDHEQDQSMSLLQNQIQELNRVVNENLRNVQTSLQNQFGTSNKLLHQINQDSTKTVREVTEKLTQLDETNKQVVNFATQLQSLENILKNPKQRGILGEYFLEDLLSNCLPQGTYKMQYKFDDGEIVDAAMFVRDKIIPIDAKFSLEKYNQIQEENDKSRREQLEKEFKSDLKRRIDETSKYIRPEEKTTDFALMFIPAEGIFYNLLMYKVGAVNVSAEDLISYAFSKKVVIVSPNTFYAYLQTILQALNALQVEEQAEEIKKNVTKLAKHLINYEEHMNLVGKHLSTTVGAYNRAGKEFGMVDKDVLKITGEGIESETPLIDRPDLD